MAEITCPHCKNPITDDDAVLCHFCGESLGRASSGALGQMRLGRFKIWFIILAIILIAGFVLVGIF